MRRNKNKILFKLKYYVIEQKLDRGVNPFKKKILDKQTMHILIRIKGSIRFLRIFTVSFLLFLAPAGANFLTGPIFQPNGLKIGVLKSFNLKGISI